MNPGTDVECIAKRLREALPSGRVLIAPAELAGYESDALGYKRFRPDVVAIPGGRTGSALRVAVSRAVPLALRLG